MNATDETGLATFDLPPSVVRLARRALIARVDGSFELDPVLLDRFLLQVEVALIDNRGIEVYAELGDFLLLPLEDPRSIHALTSLVERFYRRAAAPRAGAAFVALLVSVRVALPKARADQKLLIDPVVVERVQRSFLPSKRHAPCSSPSP